jgi:hypothetical protein
MSRSTFVPWTPVPAAAAMLFALAACGDFATEPTVEPEALLSHAAPEIVAGELEVCKHVEGGNGVGFEFTASMSGGAAGELLESSFTLHDGECLVVWRSLGPLGSPGDPVRSITVTELAPLPDGWQLDRIVVDADLLDNSPVEYLNTNEVTVPVNTYHGATAVFYNSPIAVGEGCTPGYWRNTRIEWPIDPATLFSDAFGVGPDTPLSVTVEARGGGENALLRHATAALLNAAAGLDYPLTEAEVIALVQEAYATGEFNAAKDQLEAGNELGCPLSNQ